MNDICRFDRGEIKGKAIKTDEGYIRANAVVTRTGVFLYQNADGTTRRELRHPDDVFEKKSMDSLKMIPLTNKHPDEKLVNADNAKDLSIGSTGETIEVDGAHLMSSLTITHKDGVDATALGRKELSCGYNLDLEKEQGVYNGERYDYRQRNIRYNHVAIVDRARAGGAAALHLDSGDALQVDAQIKTETKKENQTMSKKVTLDGIDYDAAPEVANALAKANKRADAAEAKNETLQTSLDASNTDKSKVEAERDTFKEKAEAKNDAAEIQKAVKARMDLERVANKVLNADEAKEIENLDDAEIKQKVIEAKFPDANLDGKDESYIQARFDIACEIVGSDKTAADQRSKMNEKRGDSDSNDLDQQRDDSFEAIKNMSKPKEQK